MLWMALDGPGETGWTNSRRNCAGKGEAMSGRGHVARKQTSQGVRYYPVVELPHDPATGKQRQRWHPAHTSRRAADRELVRLLGQLDRGANVEPNTLEVWTVYARAHVDPAIGHVLVQQLTATHLAAFYAGLADHGRRDGKGLAPKTVKNVHGLLHRALSDAVEQDLVARNVAGLKAARPAKIPRVERRVWAPEELRRFLAALAADRLAALWQLDCTTGLRRSELLGLPWTALDLGAGELAVVQRLIVVDGKPEMRLGTKTPKSARRISIDPATVAILRAHRKAQAAERLAWGPAWTDHGLVFTREDGTPLRPRQVARSFDRLVAAAGLPALTMHGLRHSYATAGLAGGVDLKVMSERLGHANVAITADLYTHVLPAMDAAAAAAVAGLILGSDGAG